MNDGSVPPGTLSDFDGSGSWTGLIDDNNLRIFTEMYVATALDDVSDSCVTREDDCGEDCSGDHERILITREDLQPATLARLELDASEFFAAHVDDLRRFPGDHRVTRADWAQTGGFNFWETRAGHGTGFGDWYEPGQHPQDPDMEAAKKRLMEAARTEGERDLFRDTDNKISHGQSWGEIQRERNGSCRATRTTR